MKEKVKLEDFSLVELKLIKDSLEKFDDLESLDTYLSIMIEKKEDDRNNLNARFDMKMFEKLNVFEPTELRVLKFNGINNLEELINCDLGNFIGLTESMKEKFEWARKFYDMNRGNQSEKAGKSK